MLEVVSKFKYLGRVMYNPDDYTIDCIHYPIILTYGIITGITGHGDFYVNLTVL